LYRGGTGKERVSANLGDSQLGGQLKDRKEHIRWVCCTGKVSHPKNGSLEWALRTVEEKGRGPGAKRKSLMIKWAAKGNKKGRPHNGGNQRC